MNISRALYMAYKDLVLARCAQALGPGRAEDAAQEAWLQLHRSKAPPQGAFPGFVRAVVRNACRWYARRLRQQEMKWQPVSERVTFKSTEDILQSGRAEDRVLADTLFSDDGVYVEDLHRRIDHHRALMVAKRVLSPKVYAATFGRQRVPGSTLRKYRREAVLDVRRAFEVQLLIGDQA